MSRIIHFIRNYAAVISMVFLLGAVSLPVPAMAACSGGNGSKNQVLQGISTTGTDCSKNGEKSLTSGVLSIISYIAGLVAVIMIVVAGFRYVTSGGDSGKVASAKGALIGAVIGMFIVVAAQAIVHIVLSNT